jgi:long-subunit fatty acid transport protein
MKRILYILILIMTAFLNLFSQDFNLTGAGARAEGFGGAFIGLADDATAVVWNPAGLTQLERAEASVVTRFISESVDYKSADDPSLNDNISQSYFSLNFSSFALPLSTGKTKIVAAIAFQRQLDFYLNVKKKGEITVPPTTYVYRYDDESRGGVNTITPAISAKINPMISVGLSANIWTGNWNEKVRLEIENVGRDDHKYDRDFSGLNFVVGGMVDFEGMQKGFPLKVGLTVRTPFTLKGTGKDDEDGDLLLSGSEQYEVTSDIQMPLMIGFGTSYRIGDNLTFAMDYEIRNYGSRKIKSKSTASSNRQVTESESNISESKKGLNEFRIGAEYLIVLDNGVIPIRGGFKTVPTVLANSRYDAATNNYVPGTQVSGSGISFGSGYITDAFAFDITFSSISFKRNRPDEDNGVYDYSTGTLSTSVIIYF